MYIQVDTADINRNRPRHNYRNNIFKGNVQFTEYIQVDTAGINQNQHRHN